MNWDITPVSELCTLAIDCVNKTAPLSEVDTPYKMLRTTNIKDGYIDFDHVRYVEKDVFDKWTRRGAPKYGDVLFTREAPVGEVGRFTSKSENYFLGQRTFLYRADPNKLDWNYLAYILQSPQIQGWVNGIAYGATVPHLKVGDMEHLMIPAPPLPTQQKIAKILSNFDDLIENNLKRIKLLEESARLTYEEWFLRFRIDGKKLDIDPETSLPFEWEKKKLGDYFPIVTGKKDANIQTNDGKYPFFTCSQGTYKTDVYSFDAEAIILAGNGEFNVKYYRGKFEAYQRNYVLIPDDRNYLFLLFLFMKHYLKEITYGSKGAVIKYLTKDMIENANFIEPAEELLVDFNKLIVPIFYEIENLDHQNQLLKEARDILLPRLMTGMIDTDDMDVAV